MKPASLVFRDVRYSRGTFNLSVNEEFPAGLLTVVLGPSGCGKTTLLDLAAGFLRPQEGRILEGEKDVTELPAHKRQVGVVFQEHALFGHLTVRDNVAYGPKVRGKGRASSRRIADNLLALTGLEEFGSRHISSLSGGERQRVALARALAVSPDLLLLDEPFSALDAALRRRLRDEVRRIQRETGITAVLVTHDQEEAMALADRLAVMRDGEVKQFGTPAELWNKPADLFTALFLGRSNHLEILEYRRNDGVQAVTAAGIIPLNGGLPLPPLPATLFFRPEELSLAGTRQTGYAKLSARVTGSEYMGGVWRTKLSTVNDSGKNELDMDYRGEEPPKLGELMSLQVNTARISILEGTTDALKA